MGGVIPQAGERGLATPAHWASFQHIKSLISGTFEFTMLSTQLGLPNSECVGTERWQGHNPRTPGSFQTSQGLFWGLKDFMGQCAPLVEGSGRS